MSKTVTGMLMIVLLQIVIVVMLYESAKLSGVLGEGESFIGAYIVDEMNDTQPSGGLWGTGYYEILSWLTGIVIGVFNVIIDIINAMVWVSGWPFVGPPITIFWGATIGFFIIRTVFFGGD